MFDICVVGHITKDVIRIGETEVTMPGGTAYYTALALKSLGMNVAVITKLNEADGYLLSHLKGADIVVFQRPSLATTTFLNVYGADSDHREQWVVDVASPFILDDLVDVDAKMFHIGPLTKADIPREVIEALAKRSKVSLDVQGFVRELQDAHAEGRRVKLTDWDGKEDVLPLIDILKTNEEEAEILDPASDQVEIARKLSGYGPKEVIISGGSKPSLVYVQDRSHWVPALPPNDLIDPTGAGDTYMAGYLFSRSRGAEPEEAARFAAVTASIKLEYHGPFRGSAEAVKAYAHAKCYSLGSGQFISNERAVE